MAIRVGVIVGDATEMGAKGMAATQPKLKAMVMRHPQQKFASPNQSVKQRPL